MLVGDSSVRRSWLLLRRCRQQSNSADLVLLDFRCGIKSGVCQNVGVLFAGEVEVGKDDASRHAFGNRSCRRHRVAARLELAEGILSCLADRNAQEFLVDAFVRRLLETDSNIAVDQSTGELAELTTVRPAVDLSPSQQGRIEAALVQIECSPGGTQFRVDQSLICGVEIRTRDHEFSWNVRESLDCLAADFSRDLDSTLTLPVGVSPSPETIKQVTDKQVT